MLLLKFNVWPLVVTERLRSTSACASVDSRLIINFSAEDIRDWLLLESVFRTNLALTRSLIVCLIALSNNHSMLLNPYLI